MQLEIFREKSRACDKLLMELRFTSSSQRTNAPCREPLAARSYWTYTRGLHRNLAGWDSATAGATCFLGSCSLPVCTPSPASTAVSHGVTFPHDHPGLQGSNTPSILLPYGNSIPASSISTLRCVPLSRLSEAEGVAGSLGSPAGVLLLRLSRWIVNLVPRPRAEMEGDSRTI